MRVQLISSEYFFKRTAVDINVDVNLVNKFIWIAQDKNIQSVLGENLYRKVLNDCPNYSNEYEVLVDYIQIALCEWTLYQLLPFINFKMTNKNIALKSTDESQPSSEANIQWLMSIVRDNAEFYSQRIRDYIKNNEFNLPEYSQSYSTYEIKPVKSAYFSGIYTSGRKKPIAPFYPDKTDPKDFY